MPSSSSMTGPTPNDPRALLRECIACQYAYSQPPDRQLGIAGKDRHADDVSRRPGDTKYASSLHLDKWLTVRIDVTQGVIRECDVGQREDDLIASIAVQPVRRTIRDGRIAEFDNAGF